MQPTILAGLIVFFSALLPFTTTNASINVELTIAETAGADRVQEPVSTGVPLSLSDNILDADDLCIRDNNGTYIPAQFRVLSRYNGTPQDNTKPIRVVLANFKASVSADQEIKYFLENSGNNPISDSDVGALNGSDAIIDTGKVKAIVKGEDAAIFSEVWVDVNGDGTYQNNEKIIDTPEGDGFIVAYNGVQYISGSTRSISIEENGPLKTVIKIAGYFLDAHNNKAIPPHGDNGISYTIRIRAFKGDDFFFVSPRLENENRGWGLNASGGSHNISIDSSVIKTTLNIAQQKTVRLDNYSDTFLTAGYNLQQRETSDGTQPIYSWQYTIDKNSSNVSDGAQYEGDVDLRDSQFGLTLSTKWFWQNIPTGIRVNDNIIYYDLLSDTDSSHRILGGMWKRHHMIFRFGTSYSDINPIIKSSLYARCSDLYYAQSEFYPWIIPSQIDSNYQFPANEPLQEALNLHRDGQRAFFDNSYSTNIHASKDFFDLRNDRNTKLDAAHYSTWYGYMTFGAMPRTDGEGYHNQHYDWSYLAINGFLRFNDMNMWKVGQELLEHKANILVIHDPLSTDIPDIYYHGGQRYEQDALFSYHQNYGVYSNAPGAASHFWTKGMSIYYLLTGDEGIKDAVLHCYSHASRIKDHPWTTDTEIRDQGRAIDALINGYLVTGNMNYLNDAYHIFVNHLLDKEGDGQGQTGWLSSHGDTGNVWLGYKSMIEEYIVKLYIVLVDASMNTEADIVKSYLLRRADWTVNEMYPTWGPNTCGTYRNSNEEYFPYIVSQEWISSTKTWARAVRPEYSSTTADLYAVVYKITGDEKWLNLARNIFKDYYIYKSYTAEFLPVKTTAMVSGLQNGAPASGYWKWPMFYTKPHFYLKTEWQEQQPPDDLRPSAPTKLKVVPTP